MIGSMTEAQSAAATPSSPIRVMIVEDQTMIRQALAGMLALEPDIEMVAQAADGEEGLQKMRAYRPDVVLMDLQMPRLGGIETTRRMVQEFPQAKIVVLTTFDADQYVFDAISAGAMAYLLKDARIADIATAIRDAARDQSSLDPLIARKVMAEFRRLRSPKPANASTVALSNHHEALGKRENEILALLVDGQTNTQIATQLDLAEGTVKNYVSRILAKLQANNRTELAARVLRG